MRQLNASYPSVADFHRPPPVVAPMDVGTDAACIAGRVVAAARRWNEMGVPFFWLREEWCWRSESNKSPPVGSSSKLIGIEDLATIDTTESFAVSFIGDSLSAGVRLFNMDGTSIALWTTDSNEFDNWLDGVVPGCRLHANTMTVMAPPN